MSAEGIKDLFQLKEECTREDAVKNGHCFVFSKES